MSLSTEDLIKIVEAGGGLVLDAEPMSKEDLVRIATAAGRCEVAVTFRNLKGVDVDGLVEIAKTSDGYIIFEF